MSKYPTQIDSDAELPRVDDNLSETSVETINALREAVMAIEKTIGANPQGSTATLVQRLSVFFNDDGTAKASALVAAGLIALPITNAMIASNAGIEESKLDLDVATQVLQNQITSNDIDIATLQASMTSLLAAYANHISGIADKHDGYAILLDKNYPVSTPPWLLGITATDVSTAIAAINNNFLDHISLSKVGAHPASAISVDASTLQNVTATDLQGAIEQLDESRAVELVDHRDDMHANGLSLWANSIDGYSEHNQIIPQTVGATVTAYILPITRNIVDFSPLTMSAFPVQQGDSVVVLDTSSIGVYPINDIGPRNAVGTKPSLTANQVEIVGTFPDDGYVTARIYGSSSTVLLKGNLATTVHQSDFKVDSIQVSRPNAARIVSLGAQPQFLDSTGVLVVEAGVTASTFRTIVIDNLHKDRNGVVVSPPTIDSLVERINSVFQNRVDGHAFPVTAYRVGDEFMLSHNWTDDFAYVRVTSAGNMNFYLGLDSNGANVEDRYIYPTANAYYYVNGVKLHDVAKITQQTASVSGQYISFTGFNPLAAGVKIGHLVHLKSHVNTNEIGTYFITDVTSSVVKVHKNAGITAQALVNVEIYHDALPLDDFNTNVKDIVIEAFITSSGTLGYNERVNYEDNISNLRIVDVSDNFAASSYSLKSSISGSEVTLKFANLYEKPVYIPTTFTGKLKIPSPHLIEYVTADITAPIGTGTSQFTFYPHINEEEVLELCSVRLDGLLTLSNIVDKRMFGTLGLDELREDVVQNYIEVPNQELRSNGIIAGFDIMAPDVDNAVPPYQDPTFPLSSNFYGLLIRGGVAMVGGVRVSTPITSVMFPNVAGTYIVGLNKLGTFKIFDTSQYSMADLLDGYAEDLALIAQVDHDGTTVVDTSLIDLRFNISKIDDKVELLFDETNHFIGHFASFKTALQYVNNYPKNEKFKIRVVAHGGGDINITNVQHSLTVVIDGQVNNVTVSGPCKITSESIASRVTPHIRGALTVQSGSNNIEISNLTIGNSNGAAVSYLYVDDDGIYKFNNVIFNGASTSGQLQIVTPGSALADQVIFESCIFKDGTPMVIGSSGIIIDNFIINNCEMYGIGTGTKIDIPSNNLVISNTIFDNCGITQTFQLSKPAIINNCVFRNMTVVSGGKRVIDTVSTFLISNTKFDNIVASTADAIISSTTYDGYTRLQLDHCSFNNCSAAVGYKLIESRGSVTNSLFKSTTCAVAPGDLVVECTEFSGNAILGQTNEFAVGASQIERNTGLNVAKGASFASLQSVVGNTFLASSVFGYNINVASTSGVEITGNVFSMGPQVAIQVDSGTGDIVINGNEFNHTGYCINTSLTSLGISFINNIVKSPLLMSGPGSGNMETVFSGNIFENASGITIDSTASRVVFQNNIVLTGPLTFNTGSMAALNISNNLFTSNLVITSDLIGSSINNNIFDNGTIDISGNVSYSIISNNIDGSGNTSSFVTLQLGASLVSHTLITNNTISLSGIASAVLSDTIITDNIIGGSSITLNIDPSAAADDYAHVTFSDNLLDDDIGIALSSSGSIRGVIVEGNIASTTTHPTYPTLSIASAINESVISSNFNFNIVITSGMNSCGIVDNIALNSDINISGACNSNIVSGNYFNDLIFSGSSTSGLLFTNMFINGSANISAVSGAIDKMSFINNVINAWVILTSTSGNFTRLAVNNNIFNAGIFNISGSDVSITSNVILTDFTLWSVTGSYTLTKANISNNTIGGEAFICSTLSSGTSSFTNSRISGNIIGGSDLEIMTAVTSGATMKFTGNIISDNFCADDLLVFSVSSRGAITFNNNSFLNNRITDQFLLNSSTTSATDVLVQKTIISGNSCDDFAFGRQLTYSDLTITGNRFNNTSTSIVFNVDPVTTPGTFSKLNLNNNIIAGIVQFTVNKASSTVIDQFIFNSNIMPTKDFRLVYAGSSTLNLTARGWIFSGNVMRAIALRTDEGGSISSDLYIQASSFNNNAFAGETAAVVGVPYEPGIYVAKGAKVGGIGIDGLSINGNFYGGDTAFIPDVQIKFATAASVSINMTNSEISNNRNIDIIYEATGSGLLVLDFININNNIFGHDTGTDEGIKITAVVTTTSLMDQMTISGNKGGRIAMHGINTIISSLITNNFLDYDSSIPGIGVGDIVVECNAFLSLTITGNRSRYVNVAAISSGSTSIGLACYSNLNLGTTIMGNSGFADINVVGNRIVGTLTVDGYGSASNLIGTNISTNTIYESIVVRDFDSVTDLNISSNNLNYYIFPELGAQDIQIRDISSQTDTIIIANNMIQDIISFINMPVTEDSNKNIIISSNYCEGLSLTGLTGVGCIELMNICNNIVKGTLALPSRTTFDDDPSSGGAGALQSKISFNFAETWTAPTAFTTSGTDNVFVWGNTGQNNSINVTFSGTTATSVGTANNVHTAGGGGSGGIIN
jgi:hypothetical protein